MARLVVCPHCNVHVKLSEPRCPHCDASLQSKFGATSTAVLLGLSLGGCTGGPSLEVEYGAPMIDDKVPPKQDDAKKPPPKKADEKKSDPLPTPDPEYGMPEPPDDEKPKP